MLFTANEILLLFPHITVLFPSSSFSTSVEYILEPFEINSNLFQIRSSFIEGMIIWAVSSSTSDVNGRMNFFKFQGTKSSWISWKGNLQIEKFIRKIHRTAQGRAPKRVLWFSWWVFFGAWIKCFLIPTELNDILITFYLFSSIQVALRGIHKLFGES